MTIYNDILGKPKTLENFLMKTAEAMEKMRRIEGRVSTDQVNKKMFKYKVLWVA